MQHRRGNFKNYSRRIFRKKASEREKQTFIRWFRQLDLSDEALADGQEDAIKEKVRQALKIHASGTKAERVIFQFPFLLRLAAAAILVFMVMVLYFHISRPAPEQISIYHEIHTRKGERKIITLEDGTSIHLNNESSLRYPENLSAMTREVYLRGEAFFQVRHNPAKPFRVHTGKLNVQVLGTSFDIKDYSEDKSISVVVASGKVAVNKTGQKTALMLLPGDRLSYNSITGTISQEKVNPSDETAWQHGQLIFRNEYLGTVCHYLERWYGVELRIQGKSLQYEKVNLEIKGDDFNSVMKMLSLVAGFQYHLQERIMVLSDINSNKNN